MFENNNRTEKKHLSLILRNFEIKEYNETEKLNILKRCHLILLKELSKNQYNVSDSAVDPIFLNNEFINQYELPIEVGKYQGNDQAVSFLKIAEILKTLQCFCSKLPLSTFSISFASSEWFSQNIISAHEDLKTTELYFGSFWRANHVIHWKLNCNSGEKIHTSFEYDKSRISTEIRQFEGFRDREGNNIKVKYEISIPFHFIRKIFVEVKTQTCFILHFLTSSPAIIRSSGRNENSSTYKLFRRHKIFCDIRSPERKKYRCSGQPAITHSSIYSLNLDIDLSTFYSLLSRLYNRSRVPIELVNLEQNVQIISENTNPFWPYVMEPEGEFRKCVTDEILYSIYYCFNCELERTATNMRISKEQNFIANKNELVYLVEALLARGSMVKCQILRNKQVWKNFLDMVSESFFKDANACLDTLEEIIHYVDENIMISNLPESFSMLFYKKVLFPVHNGLTTEQREDGYMKIRKVIITPTRLLPMPREVVMSNRAVRSHSISDEERSYSFIRVAYRDEDGRKLSTISNTFREIENTVIETFTKGIQVGGRHYFYVGSSSSQQRDHGAYFMLGVLDAHSWKSKQKSSDSNSNTYSIIKFRTKMGRFDRLDSVPRLMARLGQCFTQSRETGVGLDREEYHRIHDIIGGQNSSKKAYTFSDGVGIISASFAKRIVRDMRLRSVPGCFQIRFRGMKGVLSVDPYLDQLSTWAKENNIPKIEEHSWTLHCAFRPSQEKFEAKRYPHQPLEVVKYSGVTTLFLNKPLIAVLDFASEKKKVLHDRIKNRIHQLLDMNIRNIAKQISSDHHCKNKLMELPRRIDITRLDHRTGLSLSFEPFFRGMLLANAHSTITRQLQKLRIAIPRGLGRGMMGVLDESGRLQSGQVFFQYSSISTEYNPTSKTKNIVHIGPAMITKSPTMVVGDVRIFEAIDVPELHHLVDVLVFPSYGPRPHPDEMAGSDLDGDEYSVIWDPELLLEENSPAGAYTAQPSQKIPINMSNLNEECAKFFVNVISQDAIGVISNCHLHNSDLYHIDSTVSTRLAEKASIAIDFPKTGNPPAKLQTSWEQDEDDFRKWCPPEKVEYYPDYNPLRNLKPTYASARLIGELYREVKKVEELVSEELKVPPPIEIDALLEVVGWESYEFAVSNIFKRYSSQMRSIMASYFIQSEAELFSGCVQENRHCMAEKSTEDQSYFNTKQIIDKLVTDLYRQFRKDFFEEFGSYMTLTTSSSVYEDSSDIIRRYASHIDLKMKQKASAYYMVSYRHALENKERYLSFAWLVYDILGDIRTANVLNSDNKYFQTAYSESVLSVVKDICENHVSNNPESFRHFEQYIAGIPLLAKYCAKYAGLLNILFILSEWAENNFEQESRFSKRHLLHLLIAHGTNNFSTSFRLFDTYGRVFMRQIDENVSLETLRKESIELTYCYELLVSFFDFLGSIYFKRLSHIDFTSFGYKSILMRGEWLPLHELSARTYYTLLISLKFTIIPDNTEGPNDVILDGDPFIMLLPTDTNDDHLLEKLKYASKVSEISARSLKDGVIIIMARGTTKALRKLKDIAVVKMDRYFKMTGGPQEMLNFFTSKIQEKLNSMNM